MAKRSRTTVNEQTFLKHPFHESTSPTGYKQLKYDETATATAVAAVDDSGNSQEYPQADTLGNLSGTSVVNSPSSNPFIVSQNVQNGHSYRSGSASYLTNNGVTAAQHTISPQHSLGHHMPPSAASLRPGNTSAISGHYAANISTAAITPNVASSKKSLLGISHNTGHVRTSPGQLASESRATTQQLLSSAQASPTFSELVTGCSSNCETNGIRELLSSLALMCILSLLMAFLALFFLQRSCPLVLTEESSISNSSKSHRLSATNVGTNFNQRIVANVKEYMRVFQISVSLSTLTIALDLCCLFVCCIQFLSIVKLIKTPFGKKRSLEFIRKTSHIRVLSIGAFLVSIPIFFTGVILYTFVNFDEIPALVTSVVIGVGIIFCGIASVQNVYLWQWEKTKASQEMRLSQQAAAAASSFTSGGPSAIHHGGQQSMSSKYPLELSTLV